MKTCRLCGFIWDPNPWRKCPRCAARTRAYEPTPAQIRAACLRIQKTWTKDTERKRSAYKRVPAMTKLAEMVVYREHD